MQQTRTVAAEASPGSREARPLERVSPRCIPAWALVVALLTAACGGDPAPTPETPDSATPPSVAPAAPPSVESAPARTTTPTAEVSAAAAETAPRDPAAELPEPSKTERLAPTAPPEPLLAPAMAAALREARDLRAAGQWSDAVAALRAAEDELGDHAALRLEASWCFFDQARTAFEAGADGFLVKSSLADAQLRLDQLADLRAEDAPPLPGEAVLRARVYRYSENPDAAREVLTTHVARFDGDVAAHRELADMATTAREWATADTHWSIVAERDPTDGRARLNATVAKQWLTGEGGAAYGLEVFHDGYRMAARLLPDEDDPVRLLAGLYPNDPAGRIAAIDEVIADNGKAVWARVWKAYLLRQEGPDGTAKALEVLQEARRLAPENEAVQMNRAETLMELGRLEDAVVAYIECVESGEPGSREGASNALDLAIHGSAEARDLPEALRERAYAALCDRNPSIGRFGNNAGFWHRDIVKDYEKSLKWYQRSVDAEPEDQDYLNDTALIYLWHLRDRKELGFPMFLKVRRLVEEEGQEPIRGYWDALENLCKYYFEVGRYDDVIECADLRANPDAMLNGQPYPSLRAAAYRSQAQKKLAEVK